MGPEAGRQSPVDFLLSSGVWLLTSPDGDVAQLGEHRLCKPGVEGSIPFVSTFGLDLDLGFIRKTSRSDWTARRSVGIIPPLLTKADPRGTGQVGSTPNRRSDKEFRVVLSRFLKSSKKWLDSLDGLERGQYDSRPAARLASDGNQLKSAGEAKVV